MLQPCNRRPGLNFAIAALVFDRWAEAIRSGNFAVYNKSEGPGITCTPLIVLKREIIPENLQKYTRNDRFKRNNFFPFTFSYIMPIRWNKIYLL